MVKPKHVQVFDIDVILYQKKYVDKYSENLIISFMSFL